MSNALNHIRSGKVRLVACRSARMELTIRLAAFGEVVEAHHEGIVDFAQGRYHSTGEEQEQIGTGGIVFSRSKGADRWTKIGDDQDAPPPPGDLLWLLDLLAGVTNAEELPSRVPDRTRYLCRTDLVNADQESRDGVSMPGGYTVRQLRQLELDVALDGEGVIRELGWTLPDGNSMAVRFIQLDVDATVEVPADDETILIGEVLDE
jgi:hypothetical protein